jgi:hypothetical protein
MERFFSLTFRGDHFVLISIVIDCGLKDRYSILGRVGMSLFATTPSPVLDIGLGEGALTRG